MNQKEASLIKKLADYAGDKKYLLYLSWLLAAVSAVAMIVPYFFYYRIVRELILGAISGNFNLTSLGYNGLWAMVFVLINLALYFAALMSSHLSAFHIRQNMVLRLMEHLEKLPVGYHLHHPSGKVRKVVEENTANTETYIAHSLPDFVQALILPLVSILFLFLFDWRLGLASLLPVIFGFLIQSVSYNKDKKEDFMTRYQDAQEEINHATVEYVRGISVVKVFNQTVYSFRNFHHSIVDFKEFVLKYTLNFEFSYRIFMTAIHAVFVVLIPVFILLYNNSAEPLELVLSFMFYLLFIPTLSTAFTKIMYMSSFQTMAKESLYRAELILQAKPIEQPPSPTLPTGHDIVFEQVSFRYEEGEHLALDNVSCQLKEGQTTALVGPSGSGKTTMANLMMYFFSPTAGRITIGGVDLKEIGSDQVMKMISYVFQENKLLKMSILENVRVARPQASDEEVLEALKKAQCQDLLDRLPEGANTMYGQKGVYLSGGEVQRVAIARALLKDAPIVVLDEATAFTDPENEYKIKRSFDVLLKDKTVVMIAHRLSSIRDADKIMVVDEGRIVEQGTHDQLLEKQGKYEVMWQEFNKSIQWTFQAGGASC